MSVNWTNNGVSVYYPYSVNGVNIFSYKFPDYSYGSESDTVDQFVGCRAPYTQKILNNLPQWMSMRQNHDGVGQTLVNSWACNLEDTYDYFSQIRRNQFISTSDTHRDVHTSISELSFGDDNVYEASFRNLLYNSSFSIKGISRHNAPDGWLHSRTAAGNISLNRDEALYGTYCVKMYDAASISQSRNIQLAAGSLNLSAYIKTPDTLLSQTELHNVNTTGLVLILTYADMTKGYFGIGLPKNTNNEWIRASFSTEIEKELSKYEVGVVNNTTNIMYVDIPQLEINTVATAWTNNSVDTPPYLRSGRSTNGIQILSASEDSQSVTKIEPLAVTSESEFRNMVIPTRAEAFSPMEKANQSSTARAGRQINFFKEVMPTVWNPSSDALREESHLTSDVFISTHPADLFTDSEGNLKLDKYAITNSKTLVKASTAHNEWIYVLTEETYGGVTDCYLKFCRPRKLNYEDTHIPSYGDIKLDINLGKSFGSGSLSESISDMGICKDIPNAIYVDTDKNRRLYFKLKYDYFYADFGSRKLFFTENYSVHHGHLQVL
jgi:hypothetical protein